MHDITILYTQDHWVLSQGREADIAYKVLGMLREAGLGKDMNVHNVHVPYMSGAERAAHLITVGPGRLLYRAGVPLHASPKKFIYVMDKDGQIFSASKSIVVHHSAFLSGQPAAAAGHWKVVNGVVESADDQSGHYQPTKDYCDQLIVELKKRGVRVDAIECSFGLTSTQMITGVKKRVGIKKGRFWGESGGIEVTDYATGATLNGAQIKTGSHIQGQKLRLYPGTKPAWSWF